MDDVSQTVNLNKFLKINHTLIICIYRYLTDSESVIIIITNRDLN
jgi:hypothetical protein